MKWSTAALLLLIGPLAGPEFSHAQTQTDQKPVRVVHLHGDGGPAPPRNLDELLQRSSLVVDGVVEGARAADRNMGIIAGRQEFMVRTAYTFRVRAAFKVEPAWNAEAISVDVMFWDTGDRDRGAYIERIVNDRLQALRVGDAYLLFLHREAGAAWFAPTTEGDASVFELRDSAVVPRDPYARTCTIAKDGWSKLQAALRANGKRGK